MLNIGDFLWSGRQVWTTPVKFTTIAETVSQLASYASSSMESLKEQVPFTVFPNPASNQFNVRIDKGAEIVFIRIIDMNGRLLKQF